MMLSSWISWHVIISCLHFNQDQGVSFCWMLTKRVQLDIEVFCNKPIALCRLLSTSSILSSSADSVSSGSRLTKPLRAGCWFSSGTGSTLEVKPDENLMAGSAVVSSARLLDSAAASLLELLQMEAAGSESSMLWLRSDMELSDADAALGTRAAATARAGEEVVGCTAGGGGGACRFFSWLGELCFV